MEKTIQLSNGIRMPRLGLGVYKAPETETKQAVLDAIEAGYRLDVYKRQRIYSLFPVWVQIWSSTC